MNPASRRLPRIGIGALLALAVAMIASAGWIHVKAALAQVLLQRAWAQSDSGRTSVRPWPWADMTPIAQLAVPRLGKRFIVLDNDSGQALAFGPGWTPSSAVPATHGLSVISAHRDTQFASLQYLHQGDRIEIDGAAGRRSYRVVSMRIVDSRDMRLANADSIDALVLVTCYPFDAIVPGGSQRYVVEALPEGVSGRLERRVAMLR
ncbi:MAG TPA: class GN sortase [Rudaea sp.]|nr:class GN sortase [Rudaea sp.]